MLWWWQVWKRVKLSDGSEICMFAHCLLTSQGGRKSFLWIDGSGNPCNCSISQLGELMKSADRPRALSCTSQTMLDGIYCYSLVVYLWCLIEISHSCAP